MHDGKPSLEPEVHPHKIFIGRMLSQEAKAEIMYTYDDMRLDHLNHDSNP